jgi:DNA-binding transcriptional LysR family regulator
MNTNLHHLKLFHYVASAGGVSAAVKIIPYGIQQPAISQQLIQFEESLGVKLCERRPFLLTPAGERLYRFTSKFFNELETTLKNLEDDAGLRLRIACPQVISVNYLPRIIGPLLEDFSNLRPNVVELEGRLIFSALLNKEIDVGITMSELPRSKSIISTKILTLPLSLIVPENHKFVKEGFWPKTDFAEAKWISIQEKTGGDEDLKQGLTNFGITPEFTASTNSVEAAMNYVSIGVGIAVMAQPPESMLKPRKLKALPLADVFGELTVKVVRLKNHDIPAKIINDIISHAKHLSGKI